MIFTSAVIHLLPWLIIEPWHHLEHLKAHWLSLPSFHFSEWLHHDLPLPFLQAQHSVKVSLSSLSTLTKPLGGLTSTTLNQHTHNLPSFVLSLHLQIFNFGSVQPPAFFPLCYFLRAAGEKSHNRAYWCHSWSNLGNWNSLLSSQ